MDTEKEKKELDEVVDLFISSKDQGKKAPWVQIDPEVKKVKTQNASPMLVETTEINKRINCPAGPKAQEKIRGLLFEYLQADYEIAVVELRKSTDKQEHDRQIHMEEKVTLAIGGEQKASY